MKLCSVILSVDTFSGTLALTTVIRIVNNHP